MIHRICPPFLLLLAPFFSYMLFAQLQPLGSIGGQLRTVTGDSPSHQIMVELQVRGATITSVYADAQGRFSFNNIEGNPYHIVIHDDAYYPVDEVVTIRPESPNAYLHLFLRPRVESRNDDATKAPAAGGNPYLVSSTDYNKRFSKKAIKEFKRGVDAEHADKSDQAFSHYLAALKLAPDYYPAHNNLGSLYLSRKDFKNAEEQFRNAMRLEPNDSQAYLNLANVLLLTGRFAESEEAVASGLQRNPNSAFGYFLKGNLASRIQNYSEAEKDFREAFRLDPSMWQAELHVANVYLQQGRRADAVNQLQTFLKAFSSVAAAPRARQLLEQLQGAPKAAGTH